MSPLTEDGSSLRLRSTSCSISRVFLLHEPSRGPRVSSSPLLSVVGLAGAFTISAVLETNGERSFGDADESEDVSSGILRGKGRLVSSLVLE